MLQHQIAHLFDDFATLLELSGANPFRVRAYRQGAHVIDALVNFDALLAQNALTSVPGIGAGLAEHIREFVATGAIEELTALRAQIPRGVLGLLQVPGLGAKKIRQLWQHHEITSFPALEAACRNQTLQEMRGFGEKSADKILRALTFLQEYRGKFLGVTAIAAAEPLLALVRAVPGVERAAVVGSIRRGLEIVGDINLLVATTAPDAVRVVVAAYAVTPSELPVVLQCVAPETFAAASVWCTGSAAHVAALQTRAEARGLCLSADGLFRVSAAGETLMACADESAIYAALGLADIPPELREDRGELALAEAGTLPTLVTVQQIRGVFHAHTTASDGAATLDAMTAAVHARGWGYLGISDHSQSAFYAGGLTAARIREQWDEVARVNQAQPVRIFRGIESDILKDGALDYPDELLAQFDFVIASLHTPFAHSRAELTERTCRALKHPATRILAHPTGRLLLSREAYDVDMDEVLRVAGQEGVVVEINANPRRAELDWRLAATARQYGVRTMVSPDAHKIDDLDNVTRLMPTVRKGGWEAKDVVNTWELAQVEEWLRAPRKK